MLHLEFECSGFLKVLHSSFSSSLQGALRCKRRILLSAAEMMTGASFWDDDVCGDFFNHIDDLLDFPNDVAEEGAQEGEKNSCTEDLTMATDCVNVSDYSSFSFGHGGGGGGGGGCSSLSCTEEDLAVGLAVPCEDLDQLEWLSNFVEDSFSAGSCIRFDEDQKDLQFQTSSPISVLDDSSGNVKPVLLAPDTVVPGRARSKRPRPATFQPRPPPSFFLSPSFSYDTYSGPGDSSVLITAAEYPPELEDFADSETPEETTYNKMKKMPSPLMGNCASSRPSPSPSPRKCMHCEIQKTPQWRAGPMGPKTLCNACGVRYKSGRLYPEYRPAASPTFVASLHSNSHKRVIEMRCRSGKKEPAPVPQFTRKHSPLTGVGGGEFPPECDV